MLSIDFGPESDLDPTYVEAADEYAAIWRREGKQIVAAFEDATSLTFAESFIHAHIYEGPSRSHPLSLRASLPAWVKRGCLVHELGHRLVYGARNPRVEVKTAGRPSSEQLHRHLNLFLFDVWTGLFGDTFAQEMVEWERRLGSIYIAAWDWALRLDRDRRANEFRRTLVVDSIDVDDAARSDAPDRSDS